MTAIFQAMRNGAAAVFASVNQAVATVTGVAVSPASSTLAGGAQQQFSAVVSGTNSPSQSVTWSKSGPGTLSASGLFTAPALTNSIQFITITATSAIDGTKLGTATVTIPALVVTPSLRTIRIQLATENGLAANLTGMEVSFHAASGPGTTGLAIFQSVTETTDSQGWLEFTMDTTAIAIGGSGLVSVLMPDGHHYLGRATVA